MAMIPRLYTCDTCGEQRFLLIDKHMTIKHVSYERASFAGTTACAGTDCAGRSFTLVEPDAHGSDEPVPHDAE